VQPRGDVASASSGKAETPGALVTLSTAKGPEFCLSAKDVSTLSYKTAPNPHCRSAALTRLYCRTELLLLATAKHGGSGGIAAAAARRAVTAAKAAATRLHNLGWREGANPTAWTPETHSPLFTKPFRATVLAFLLAVNRSPLRIPSDVSALIIKLMVEVCPPRKQHLAKLAKLRASRFGRGRGYDAQGRRYEYDEDDSDGNGGYDYMSASSGPEDEGDDDFEDY
jgi:hypothetical protein